MCRPGNNFYQNGYTEVSDVSGFLDILFSRRKNNNKSHGSAGTYSHAYIMHVYYHPYITYTGRWGPRAGHGSGLAHANLWRFAYAASGDRT